MYRKQTEAVFQQFTSQGEKAPCQF